MNESSYIAYFDESGDHGMDKIDKEFPVFVLCGWLFRIEDYLKCELESFSRIKFKHFGHDAVIFHSRDIRKQLGYFQILTDKSKRDAMMKDIADYFEKTSGTLIAAGIDKNAHKKQYKEPISPYSMSLLFCLERLYACLKDKGETGKAMYCVFEERGAKEDQELALIFEKICGGQNNWGKLPFQLIFASKRTNMPGLQGADLAAYPIARYIIDPKSKNPAYGVLEKKFRRSPGGKIEGWGLKIFP
jgi:hypothetical protein